MKFLIQEVHQDESIDILNLSPRVDRALKRHHFNTIGRLHEAILSGELVIAKGIGSKGIAEIKEVMKQYRMISVAPIQSLNTDEIKQHVLSLEFERQKPEQPTSIASEPRIAEILSETLELQALLIRRELEFGLLHWECQIGGKTINQWMLADSTANVEEKISIHSRLTTSSINIADELMQFLVKLDSKRTALLVGRYGLRPKTLEALGGEYKLTRERIRQLCTRIEQHIIAVSKYIGSTSRIQTALLIAGDMGQELTFERWTNKLLRTGLLGDWEKSRFASLNPVEVMLAICRILQGNDELQVSSHFAFPANLFQAIQLAAEGKPSTPARVLDAKRKLPAPDVKQLRRYARFCGVISVKWFSRETGIEAVRLRENLEFLGYRALTEEWYVPVVNESTDNIGRQHVFENALRKMFLFCGRLSTDEICSGLRKVVSRTNYPVAPPQVMKLALTHFGYQQENELFYWDREMAIELAAGERLILDFLNTYRVAHHAELAQLFIDSELSFPSLHGTLNRSPLFEAFRKPLYKIRGATAAEKDIKRAESAAEKTPANVDVVFTRDGQIKISITLGILAIATGTLISNQFPNLTGEWSCFVGQKEVRSIVVSSTEIKRLQKTLQLLNCQVGDRIQLSFNTFSGRAEVIKVGNTLS